MLLRAVDHRAAVKLRIGNEAAAGERRAGAIIHQGGKPDDVDATHRRGLRHGPEFAGVAAKGGVGHVDGQVRQGPPEVSERDALPEASHWLYTSMDPLMTTSFGEKPRPATAV